MRNCNLHCIPQLGGIIHRREHQQTQNHTPEVPTQLWRQIISQVLQEDGSRWINRKTSPPLIPPASINSSTRGTCIENCLFLALNWVNTGFKFGFCVASVDVRNDFTHSTIPLKPRPLQISVFTGGCGFKTQLYEQRSCSTQLCCVTTCGRRHVQHESLFLPVRIPLTRSAVSTTAWEELLDNFLLTS